MSDLFLLKAASENSEAEKEINVKFRKSRGGNGRNLSSSNFKNDEKIIFRVFDDFKS